MMVAFDIDIMLLTEEGIQLRKEYIIPFNNVKKLSSSSTIDLLIMIEMLILLINSFDKIAKIFRAIIDNKVIISCSMDSLCLFECSCCMRMDRDDCDWLYSYSIFINLICPQHISFYTQSLWFEYELCVLIQSNTSFIHLIHSIITSYSHQHTQLSTHSLWGMIPCEWMKEWREIV